MQVTGKVTAKEFEDIRRIIWAPHYRLNLFNNFLWHRLGFFRLMLGILILTITVTALVDDKSHVKFATTIVLIAFGTLLTIVILRSQHPSAKYLAKMNADMPESLELTDEGIQVAGTDGIISVIAWSLFHEWRMTDKVAVLNMVKQPYPLVVPLECLSITNRDSVRNLLIQKLGKPE